mmetsp:Transcript_26464/g.55617  ORF Transcript_26464/g.55617 Transcript_26464/m.55617 type:complete len:93 (+) Transcript_26464:109-387(+)
MSDRIRIVSAGWSCELFLKKDAAIPAALRADRETGTHVADCRTTCAVDAVFGLWRLGTSASLRGFRSFACEFRKVAGIAFPDVRAAIQRRSA